MKNTNTATTTTKTTATTPKYAAPVHTTYGTSPTVISEKELLVIKILIANNNCGATTMGSLVNDNMSCSTAEELIKFTGWNRWAVAGVLSSLDKRDIVVFTPRCRLSDVPALRWVSTWFLEELDPDMAIDFSVLK